jgi:peroxiredoxin
MIRRFVPLAAVAVMAAFVSTALAVDVGDKAPEFKAKGVDGKEYTLDSFKDAKAIVVTFTCNRCPVAVAYEDRFIDFAKKYDEKGVKFVALNVNSGEDLEAMKERAEEKGFNFPYVYDASGDSARAYGAKVTPHIFVLNEKREVVYIGSFDDKQNDPKKSFVEDAVEATLKGEKPEVTKNQAFGCGIQPAKPGKKS